MLVRSPTLTKRLSSVIENGSRPESRIAGSDGRHRAPGGARHGRGDGRDVLRGGAAAAADQVDEAGLGELADHRRGLLGRLVVLAERVGQTGVGIAGDEGVGDPAHLGDVGPHLGRAQGTVQPDRQRPDVAHRRPERLGHLPRQRPAGRVGDGPGDDHRPTAAVLLEQRLDGEDRRLGVEGVEDRLDDEEVGTAVDQASAGVGVRRDELVVGHVAGAGVVDVGRDGRGAGGGAQGSGDVPRAVRRLPRHLVADPPRQPGRLEVDLVGEVLEAVVAQRDRRRVEGVGLDDVRAGLEVLAVDGRDDLRLGQGQQVVVALEVGRPLGEALAAVARLGGPVPLDGRAHGPVEDHDPVPQQRGELVGGVRPELDAEFV